MGVCSVCPTSEMLEHGRRLVERVSRERATVHFYSQVNYFPNICWPSKTSKTETQVARILVEQPLLPLQDGGLSAAEEAGEEDCWISDHQFSGPILGITWKAALFLAWLWTIISSRKCSSSSSDKLNRWHMAFGGWSTRSCLTFPSRSCRRCKPWFTA